jgi:hypothetical protein
MKLFDFKLSGIGASVLFGALALLALPLQPVRAAIGTSDVVPAATLLLPYFEVDLNNQNGRQTAIRVTNTSATAILQNVTLWSDLGVPTFNFNIYQPGYTSTDIDLRLIFKGILPITASDGQDPMDTISPQGPLSQDINFASCTGTLPYAGLLPTATITGLRNAHTGQGSTLLSGNCAGVAYGDGIARGFVTIDIINQCTIARPTDAGYFVNGGAGIATAQNVMTGTVSYVDRSQNLAYAEPLVHVEASAVNPLTDGPGDNTFYGRFVAFSGADNREALMAVSQARYIVGGATSNATDAIVWRDPGVAVLPFACGATPAPFPLSQQQIAVFDEVEEPVAVTGSPFPYAAQRVAASTLTSNIAGFFLSNLTRPAGDPAIAGRHQSYFSVRHTISGAIGGSTSATEISNAGRPAGSIIILPIGN